MAEKTKSSGLILRNGIWHIDKRMKEAPGGRLRESTGETDFDEALEYLGKRINEIKRAVRYGERPDRSMYQAAEKHLEVKQDKRSIADDAAHLDLLLEFIGDLPIRVVNDDSLKPFIDARKASGVKNSTINRALEVVRSIMNQAAREWRDEHGLTWLAQAPLIKMLDEEEDERPPYPLHLNEQKALFSCLSPHLAEMAEFKVNTGLREQEVCKLRWDWEQPIPELNTSIFVVPKGIVKNKQARVVVLNDCAKSIIERNRHKHPTHVFSHEGKSIGGMNNTGWRYGRIRAAIKLIKAETDVVWLEEKVKKSRRHYLVSIRVWRRCWEPIVACYSLDAHEEDLIRAGKKPLKPSRRKAGDVRQAVRYKAYRRLIDLFFPKYSEFSRTRVHDVKHTVGRRLRAAGVHGETRSILLGHRTGDITTHYSAAEFQELIDAVQKICNAKAGISMNVAREPHALPLYGRHTQKRNKAKEVRNAQ